MGYIESSYEGEANSKGSLPKKKVRLGNYEKLITKLRNLEHQHKNNKEGSILQQISLTRQNIDDILSDEIEKKLRFTKQTYYESGL